MLVLGDFPLLHRIKYFLRVIPSARRFEKTFLHQHCDDAVGGETIYAHEVDEFGRGDPILTILMDDLNGLSNGQLVARIQQKATRDKQTQSGEHRRALVEGHRLFEKHIEYEKQSHRDRQPAGHLERLPAAMEFVVVEFSHNVAFHFFSDSVPELVRRSNSIGATEAFSKSVHNVPLPA